MGTRLRDRLESIVGALPDSASVTVPVGDLREWLECDGGAGGPDIMTDFTVDDVAELLGRTPACVRGWCRAHRVPGAFRLNGREWRIPKAGLRAYLERARDGQGYEDACTGTPPPDSTAPGRQGSAADLGAWRQES